MKCPSCNQRKGKRNCPALRGQICTQCCGEKRVVHIQCPSDCPFLKSGQSYHWTKKYVSMLDEETNPRKKQQLYETTQQFFPILAGMEKVIVGFMQEVSALRDKDILESLDLLVETFRTESRGLIYSPSSPNPLAQSLSKELMKHLERQRQELREKGYHLKAGELLGCAEVIQADVRHHLKAGPGERDYQTFIRRSHPDVIRTSRAGGLILAP